MTADRTMKIEGSQKKWLRVDEIAARYQAGYCLQKERELGSNKKGGG